MTISLRLSRQEEMRLNEMKHISGLSTTALIKKCLFDNSDRYTLNKDMLPSFGKMATNINLAKLNLQQKRLDDVKSNLDIIEQEVIKWQS